MHRGVAICLALVVLLAGCSSGVPAGPTEEPPVESTESPVPTTANGTVQVHFINVGQSVATLVVSPAGETMLIDTGHYRDDGEHVLSYLEAHDVERIDHLVVSHNDADHIGGNAAIIDHYETEADGIGAVYDPGIAASTQTYSEYLDAVERHDVTLYETRAGDRIDFAGVDVDVFGPPEPYLEDEARNENSIVLKLSYGQTSFLFTGDAEDDQEAQLVETYGDRLQATVLKAGHHGSSSSTSEALLDAANPEFVVVSSAYDSQYGHPAESTLGRLAERSIPTYWTATHGDTVLVSDGQSVAVRTQRAAPTDPNSLRDGDPIDPETDDPVETRRTFGPGAVSTATSAGTTPSTATATDGGTTAADAALVIERIHADAEGDDRDNLNDEYVVFRNDGDATLDLSGWTVADEVGKTYTVPDGVTLAPGETLTLHTGSGTDTETDLYWDAGSPVWNNGGDTIIVRNSDGDVVREETYG